MTQDDYEHWGDDEAYASDPVHDGAGYDNYNGLRQFTYVPPSNQPAMHAAAPRPAASVAPMPVSHIQMQPVMGYQPVPVYSQVQPVYYWPGYVTYAQPVPAAVVPVAAPRASKRSEKRSSQSNIWVGRTKAQVDEDNMRIAERERACDKRKMAPVEIKDDAFLWVVEPNGSTVLRAFADIKGLEGEWKQDPRFEDSWYFIRD